MNKTYSYRINTYAEVEGNNASGWRVYNLVTGLQDGPVYRTFQEARDSARFKGSYYSALEG